MNDADRARLFDQLATLEKAGLPRVQAARALVGDAPAAARDALTRFALRLSRGESVARAGERAGLWRGWEVPVIDAAEHAGRLEQALTVLADHYRRWAQRVKRFRSKLVLPAAVGFIGLWVSPLPALVRGDLTPVGYLSRVFIPLVLVVILATAVRGMWRHRHQGIAAALLGHLAATPLGGGLRRRWHRRRLWALALMLESGVDAAASLRRLAAVEPWSWGRHALVRLAGTVDAGQALVPALSADHWLPDADRRGVLLTDEVAGRLPEGLRRYLLVLDEREAERLDAIAQWLPPLMYGLIIAAALL